MSEDETHRYMTRLSHAGRAGTNIRGFVNPAVHRGSTMLYPNMAERMKGGAERLEQKPHYGTGGNPTHWALENVIAEIEGGTRCQVVSTGLAAVTVPLLAYVKSGDHVLMPDSAYGPARSFCDSFLSKMGVATTYYDPCIDAAGIEALFRAETTVLYLESPGSHSFEMQDVPALAAVGRRRGATVMLDNTWGIHHFQPFRHGVHVSIQALTKYVVGHSDVLLGSVTVASEADWERVRGTSLVLGQYASPDDCWLALRGVRTMGVRMEHQMRSAIAVADWLRGRPEIREVLYPALPGARGHEIWRRDFTGACSLFGIVFRPDISREQVFAMAEALQLFGKGASWGGYESLALPSTGFLTRTATSGELGGQAMRLHVGLEDVEDLKADLAQGLAVMNARR
ncbi:MAG: cystathionine beta-lyase [Alphaproteobacteria bacterium]|nr:cystathionine beta-lyase [Alphaproteobacteria bacterium]